MRIVFYSTNSTVYDKENFHYFNFPKCKSNFEKLKLHFPFCDFFVVTQEPGIFLLDLKKDGFLNKSNKIEYIILPEKLNIFEISEKILELSPDIAISITGFYKPFDWQGIKDSLIAEELKKHNIKILCNNPKTQNICFNKQLFQLFLENHNFKTPKGIYINHELFWAERNRLEINENVYKEKIFYELEKLKFPVIIKDTTGLSSFGMEVVSSFREAKSYLLSKKNNADKLVQELIIGEQFGIEIYGTKKNYTISKPFLFSVNKYKITSPKQSIKIGPVEKSKYKIKKLNKEITRLANLLNLNGIAQIDLVFDGKNWFFIEINPRISGMTNTVCESFNTNILILLTQKALNLKTKIKNHKIMSIKLPLISEDEFNQLKKIEFIKQINQTENENAKQKRETGYCEIIIDEKNGTLKQNLDKLKTNFPNLIEEIFYIQAINMLPILE